MDSYIFTNQEVLERLSRHCPRAISTYILCLNKQSDSGEVFLPKIEIIKDMSESYTVFKNNLKSLARENLLEWNELNDGLFINLATTEE